MISFSLPLTEGAASSAAPSSVFSVSAINPPAKITPSIRSPPDRLKTQYNAASAHALSGYDASAVWLTVPFRLAAGRKKLPGKHGQQDLIAARQTPGKTPNQL